MCASCVVKCISRVVQSHRTLTKCFSESACVAVGQILQFDLMKETAPVGN